MVGVNEKNAKHAILQKMSVRDFRKSIYIHINASGAPFQSSPTNYVFYITHTYTSLHPEMTTPNNQCNQSESGAVIL